jgi:putative PIN family toxin of toxin-antitoxin system
MRVVIDCNVLISAGISKGGTCGKVLEEVIRHHEWYFSHPTLQEFLSVIQYPHLKRYKRKLKALEKAYREAAIEIKPDPTPIDLPDPDDAVYLQTAATARADVVITGNKKHFPPNEYRGILILSPSEFLDSIQHEIR